MNDTKDLMLPWEFVADTVMGGVSEGRIAREDIDGRAATRLTGDVSLENNGGFVQMAADLKTDGSNWLGLEMEVLGNGETYELRLKTDQLTRPWQSYRAPFEAVSQWNTLRFPFADLEAYRTDAPFDPSALRRIGILAVGRAFSADIAVAGVRLFR